ncbi:TPA: hypothetical protein ACX4DQ_002273 [Enterococcus faecalis]|uniref:hypothetical protein n=1 Tax=Enterococcus faecalis TaxID=1351 RepID=UPI001EE3EBE5|nr:hypothetical protein [Enterococcus faecalis]EHB5081918.1 hypothetical protein [Enterococcus faecalis]EKK5287620.1 hypothetical protein [Enterococcus faecalis]MDK7897384.1 hypothetical protein [Enterococcus faecalis]UKU96304.1 hypothetical protein L5I25_09715 [Enterococcus faecalis]UKU98999.1 hypothetical protein L5I23_09795 [Enterococcus faecalis]
MKKTAVTSLGVLTVTGLGVGIGSHEVQAVEVPASNTPTANQTVQRSAENSQTTAQAVTEKTQQVTEKQAEQQRR